MTGATIPKFELAAVGNHVLLVMHAIRRHRLLFASVWVVVVAASIGLMAALPKVYDVQTTIQVSPAYVISSLNARTRKSDAPGKNAAETVLRHENLVALVRQTGLVEQWPRTRAPLMKLKDAIWERVFPRPSEEDRVEGFAGLLEQRLYVLSDEATVTIGVRFPDSELAFRLVEAAQQNFLEARQVAEISSIGDAIAILENRTAQTREVLDETLKRLQDLRQQRATRLGRPVRPAEESPIVLESRRDKDRSQLLVRIQNRRQAIADLEEARRRRVLQLETQLEELKGSYSETHPAMRDLRQKLQTWREDSPQLAELRTGLLPLEAELRQRGLLSDVALKPSRAREVALRAAALDSNDVREDRNPDIDYAKSELRHALAHYQGMLDRIDAARLELDSAQAAFKYRYVVIRPPQRPRAPLRPRPLLVVLASLVAGLFLATISPALVDLSSRRLVEGWQVQHSLGLPLLGELRDTDG
jgi:uncharacterized protein involved in exopolysaccharide biosynthesis